MCGRYTVKRSWISIVKESLADYRHDELNEVAIAWQPSRHPPRYNAAPGQDLPVILGEQEGLRPAILRWGLIPSWAQDEKIAWSLINARAETVASKPAFRAAFRRRRCAVVADGFYEWKKVGAAKQPWRFMRPGGQGLLLAGLWEEWNSPEKGPLRTFTIVTTEPNAVTAPVHDRMPVVLEDGRARIWLDPQASEAQLDGVMRPASDEYLTRYAVSTVVNNARNDVPECIEPVDPAADLGSEGGPPAPPPPGHPAA